MKRTMALAATAAVGALVFPITPASAAHQGQMGCPPPFDALTEAEQYALAAEMGVPPEVVAESIAAIDKNGDRVLCFKFLPTGQPNIIDNRSAIT